MASLTVPITGNQSTLTFSGGITTFLTSISAVKIAQSPLDITVLATSSFHKQRPGDLRALPEVAVEFYWMGAAPPITSLMIPTAEPYAGATFTIAYGGTIAGSITGTAFVKEVDFPSVKNGELMKGSMTVCFDGVTGPTYTAA